GRLRQPVRFLRTVFRIHKWIRRNELGVVFSWMSKAHLYASLPARLNGAKAVWFQFDVFSGAWLDRINSTLPTDLVFCCSQAGADAQAAAFPKLAVAPVHLAVDLDKFNRNVCVGESESRRELG